MAGSSGDMANAEEGISKLELKGEDYKQASIFAIQKKQRKNMRYMVIGKVVALLFAVGMVLVHYFISS
ncbi:hypothetical protein J0X12_14995 [Sneathiella sp. CAU 1612]|uniref:t-SNARE coiled-coil homology domain-containing protein n=1 Tax=Sneathiella sedimenti TaxID=2816034 RepID=A0ABS3FA05_9PROT|nr:hypothetical protein [Sneathiella sedimenti]MBO0334931.1 hypothetical protein [Sneathiella sedimenti]